MKKILATMLVFLAIPAFAQNLRLKNSITFYDTPQASPNAYFYDIDDRRTFLSDFLGTTILIHVWNTSCAICIYELPKISELERTINNPDFKVLIIHTGDETAFDIRQFLKKRNIFIDRNYIDKRARFASVMKSTMLPVSFIIDSEGRELAREYGAIDWNNAGIKRQIANMIKTQEETR